jgi:DNA polymerase-3 subunit chi
VTTIDFYFNAGDPLQVACRLAAKALAQGKRMLVHATEPELATRIDRMLWTWPAIGFVPHCAVHDPLAAQTPVLIGSGEESASDCQLLLNLGPRCPPSFERFDRLLEVVGAGEEERNAGRERYKFYRERGYQIANHDLAKAAPRGDDRDE